MRRIPVLFISIYAHRSFESKSTTGEFTSITIHYSLEMGSWSHWLQPLFGKKNIHKKNCKLLNSAWNLRGFNIHLDINTTPNSHPFQRLPSLLVNGLPDNAISSSTQFLNNLVPHQHSSPPEATGCFFITASFPSFPQERKFWTASQDVGQFVILQFFNVN